MSVSAPPASALSAPSRNSAPRKNRGRLRPGRILAWVYLGLFILGTIFPIYWMLRTALSSNSGLIAHPSSMLPVDFSWGGFQRVLGLQTGEAAIAEGGSGASISLLLPIRNSIIYAGIATACQVFFAALAAYAFSRLQWKGRDLVFRIMFTALMVPGILTLLPNFVLVRELGLMNTFGGLILPGALFSAFNIFFLRQFFLGMNNEVEEAALLDGASRMRVFFQITLPLSTGPVTTLSVLGFIGYWNDYFWPLLITSDETTQPLTLALAVFKQSSPQAQPDWSGLMAAALFAALPMLIVFMIFGRKIVNSLGFSGFR